MEGEALRQLLGLDVARSIRNLLEDFESIGVGQYSALIPSSDFDSNLRDNVAWCILRLIMGREKNENKKKIKSRKTNIGTKSC